jgi:tetratricopeptide (TPR) repeat protein
MLHFRIPGKCLTAIAALTFFLALAGLSGCSAKSDAAKPDAAKTDPAATDTSKQQEALMNQGMEALKTRNNAAEAAALFQQVLNLNPAHYGATFQLANALERSGRSEEAFPVWERTLGMADKTNDKPTADTARQYVLMHQGLALVNKEYDPEQACPLFQKVLELNPEHYGAAFQLATALDLAGRPTEARPVWEKVLAMASKIQDTKTAAAAKERLAKLDAVGESAFMYAGLKAFYKQKNPAEAATLFRRVLAANPAHYGATYQLAAALDAAGKPAEAEPVWVKTLAMAEKSNDQAIADKARARLKKPPSR